MQRVWVRQCKERKKRTYITQAACQAGPAGYYGQLCLQVFESPKLTKKGVRGKKEKWIGGASWIACLFDSLSFSASPYFCSFAWSMIELVVSSGAIMEMKWRADCCLLTKLKQLQWGFFPCFFPHISGLRSFVKSSIWNTWHTIMVVYQTN